MAKDLVSQMREIVDEYTVEVAEALEKAVNNVKKQVVRKLKDTSPKRPGHGEYARSWTSQKTGKRARGVFLGGVNVTVYNREHYRLTHLLEHGHVVRNKKGTYGRAPAYPHIGPAEELAIEELPKEFEKGLNK